MRDKMNYYDVCYVIFNQALKA